MNIPALRHISIVTILCSLFTIVAAQSEENTPPPAPTASMFQIGFINETALYYHLPMGDDLYLKNGLSMNWSFNQSDNGTGSTYYYNGGTPEERKNTETFINATIDVGLSSLAMFILKRYELVQMSLGVGPAVLYSVQRSTSNNNRSTDTTFDRSGSEYQFTTVGIGPSVSALFSANVYGSIFVTAEYNVSAYYCWNNENYNSRSEYKSAYSSSVSYYRNNSKDESNSWRIRLSGVRVGLMFGL